MDETVVAEGRSGRVESAATGTAKGTPYFSLEGLSVGYAPKNVLIRDIDIEVARGEILTLIGPNGAGKSTILKTITRQLKPLGGRVMFDGQDIERISYHDLATRMAVVLTERLKPELMTCYDIVATGRYPYTGKLGMLTEEDEQKVERAMAMTHTLELGNNDFTAISDGQRQRILLARAICQEPEIIVLDEPTSFLDIHHKLELLSILRSMAKQNGITVIMALHEIDLAMKISDKIACIKGDTLFMQGTPDEVFSEERIRELYDLNNGFFDTLFGSIELPRVEGEARALVLSSSGSGIPVFRALRTAGVPFAAGPLYENDIDYQLARLLAVQVIAQRPFEPLSQATIEAALDAIGRVEWVIDAGVDIGDTNRGMVQLLEAARDQGKLVQHTQADDLSAIWGRMP